LLQPSVALGDDRLVPTRRPRLVEPLAKSRQRIRRPAFAHL